MSKMRLRAATGEWLKQPLSMHRSGSYRYDSSQKKSQLWRLLAGCLAKWPITLSFAVATAGILWKYATRGIFEPDKKKEFNALIIGLSILLGINIASSLKQMVSMLRWWLLSLKFWTPREVDLILQSEHLGRMIRLLWISPGLPLQLYISTWLLLNVAAQIGLASLGLFYNVNAAESVSRNHVGTVSVSDLSSFATSLIPVRIQSKDEEVKVLQYLANSFASVSLAYHIFHKRDLPTAGMLFKASTPRLACDDLDCTMVFLEDSSPEKPYRLSAVSDRSVSARSYCTSTRVLAGGAGGENNITLADTAHTVVRLPRRPGVDQLSYLVDVDRDMHRGWSLISAFESSAEDPWFYRCNVTLGQVVNATMWQHELGDDMLLLAPAAVALEGYTDRSANTSVPLSIQMQSYPAPTVFGDPCNGNVSLMNNQLSAAAIGVIMAATESTSWIIVPGMAPEPAMVLNLAPWRSILLILGLLVGLQLVFGIGTVIVANTVTVRDHSQLGEAALLRHALEDFGPYAFLASEKELADMFPPGTTLRYEPDKTGVFLLKVYNT